MASKTPVQQARFLAVQTLYAWIISENDISSSQADILHTSKNSHKAPTIKYLTQAIAYIEKEYETIKKTIETHLVDTPWNDISPTSCAILLLAVYEMLEKPRIPYAVIMNEAIHLSKSFSETGGHKFINATLDNIAKKLPKRLNS